MGNLRSFEIGSCFNAGRARASNSVFPLFMQAIASNNWNVALKREAHNSLGVMCLPYREERILGDWLGRRFGKQSGVGEAAVVGRAKDDVVKHPDAEDL